MTRLEETPRDSRKSEALQWKDEQPGNWSVNLVSLTQLPCKQVSLTPGSL